MDNANIVLNALQITGIGILILFISLLVLWGVMELLVRFVKDPTKTKTEEDTSELSVAAEVEPAWQGDELKLRVAVATAVAVSEWQDDDLNPRVAAAAVAYVLNH